VQVATAQRPAVHTWLWQSAASAQREPSPHAVHVPAQSTSLSLPLRTVSLHVGRAPRAAGHDDERQSLRFVHARPSAQGAQTPPQSRSVSMPFLMPSLQVCGADALQAERAGRAEHAHARGVRARSVDADLVGGARAVAAVAGWQAPPAQRWPRGSDSETGALDAGRADADVRGGAGERAARARVARAAAHD